nr:DDE-type integrase/transposase/recombinase [Rhodococcus erythropolis]
MSSATSCSLRLHERRLHALRRGPCHLYRVVGRILPSADPCTFCQPLQHLPVGVATIAGIQAGEGKLYLCAIKDACGNRIVGYSIDSRMKARLAVTALNNALARRGDVTGCVVHSDRGSQFSSRKFLNVLTTHDLIGSMGKVGACGDNAAMESFFSLLQKSVLDRQAWATRQELRTAIVTWIERTYHRRRRQAALGRLTPIEYETIMNTPAAPAA